MDYKKVIEAYLSGAIDREKWMLIFDSDEGHWRCLDSSLSDEEKRTAEVIMDEKHGTPSGYSDLVALAKAAGVNAEWC